jgi:membrane-bound ClpP family serine protease
LALRSGAALRGRRLAKKPEQHVVRVLELRGMVNPVSERYLAREIETARSERVGLVII